MFYSFNVKLTDEDYLLFNDFALKNSDIGKKTDRMSKILIILIMLVAGVNVFLTRGIDGTSVTTAVILLAIGVLFCLFSKKFNTKFIKAHTRIMLKGKDKKPYTPDSVLEFYDSCFKEISPDNKSEINYSAIDKISAVKNCYIFLFLDGIRGYVVPVDCFENETQEKEFLDFLSARCNKIEFFDKL